jgi:hypothetical protein
MGILETIFENFWTIVGLILGGAGILLGIYFYYRPQKIKKPCYAIKNTNLIQDLKTKYANLEILFSRIPIKNFTVTKVAFWNWGKETINYSDVASGNPLEIFVYGSLEILDAKIIFSKNPVNKFDIELSTDHKTVKILFDYIDEDEGVIIQILHNGKKPHDIGVRGTIKGVKEITCTTGSAAYSNTIISRFFRRLSVPSWKYRNLKAIGWFLLPIILGALFFIPPTDQFIQGVNCAPSVIVNGSVQELICKPVQIQIKNPLTTPPILIIYVLFAVIPYWFMALITVKRKIPRGFDIFEDDEYNANE